MSPGRSTGVLATAGNLLFIGGQGGIVALDAKTGENLWHIDVGQNNCDGACMEASAMTYMVGGKQYVAMTGYGVLNAYSLTEEGRALTAAGSPPQRVSSKPEQTAELPNAPGKDVTVLACTNCHPAEIWSRFRMSRAAWDGAIKRMMIRGLTLNRDEYKTVLDYLSTQLGSKR